SEMELGTDNEDDGFVRARVMRRTVDDDGNVHDEETDLDESEDEEDEEEGVEWHFSSDDDRLLHNDLIRDWHAVHVAGGGWVQSHAAAAAAWTARTTARASQVSIFIRSKVTLV